MAVLEAFGPARADVAHLELPRERPSGAAKRITAAPRAFGGFEEALELPADLLGALPRPPRIALWAAGVSETVVVALDGSAGEGIVLGPDEWRAIVSGACADRLWPADFVALCRRKSSDPAWRIDEETALAGAQPDPRERWSARRVLDRIGAFVLSIDVEE
jgi:hypothetical protein